MSSNENRKQEFVAKRKELLERLDAINQDYRRGLDADSEERAVQLENAEVLEGIAKAAQEELERIEKELAAMD